MSLLRVERIFGGYGSHDVIKDLTLRVEPSEIVVVIGPNGAGKSTALKAAFGLVRVRQGRVLFKDLDITNSRPDRLVEWGAGFVPQSDNVFPTLTIEENLEMGAYRRDSGVALRKRLIYELFPPLGERRRQRAGTLSGGQRQMLAMGRALMPEPELLLLDEPTAGLSPKYAEEIFGLVQAINREFGVGVLMIEQNARRALEIAHRGYLLVAGENRLDGSGAALLANDDIGRLFLGAE